MKRLRVGVLASGSGTNLQALLDAGAHEGAPYEVAVVISNVAAAYATVRAQIARVPTELIEHNKLPDRDAFERALAEALERHGVELVCLAGFMRLLGAAFLSRFPGRVINIHPALLPAFPGMHAVRQALERGVKVAGCTVHFVDAGMDTGPIVAQAAVPVLAGDDEAALAARILAEEHKLYPQVVRLVAEGRVRLEGRRVQVDAAPGQGPLSLENPGGA